MTFGPLFEGGAGLPTFGLFVMFAYLAIGVGSFVLVTRALLSLSERLAAKRERELGDLRRRYAGGELGE